MRTFVLGIDGTPYSFLKERFSQGKLPNLAALAGENGIKRINSVYPTISSVAWTNYMTGANPGEHGIFGFVNRIADPFAITIPTARDRKMDTIWNELSRSGKRTIVINVPLTYPPEEVNGLLISGFLCTEIEKCTYPAGFSDRLKKMEYIVDADAWLVHSGKKSEFLRQLELALDKRFTLAFELLEDQEWDYFQLHIMETDRLFHFFWQSLSGGDEYSPAVDSFFSRLDRFVGDLISRLKNEDRLLVLSDHGFCAVKNEVQLNAWLQEQGLLVFDRQEQRKLTEYKSESLCYSLLPGRIFINLKGREEKGSVEKGDYQALRQDIKKRLKDLRHPDSGERIIDKVFFREEIYQGPYLDQAADIIAHPVNGYDLKGKVGSEEVFETSPLSGMHTYDDAFALGVNLDLSSASSIQDFKKIIMS